MDKHIEDTSIDAMIMYLNYVSLISLSCIINDHEHLNLGSIFGIWVESKPQKRVYTVT